MRRRGGLVKRPGLTLRVVRGVDGVDTVQRLELHRRFAVPLGHRFRPLDHPFDRPLDHPADRRHRRRDARLPGRPVGLGGQTRRVARLGPDRVERGVLVVVEPPLESRIPVERRRSVRAVHVEGQRDQRIVARLLRGQMARLGHIAFALHRQQRIGRAAIALVAIGHVGGERRTGDHRQQLVEARHPRRGDLILGHAIEPAEMGEQQPPVEAPPTADKLAAIPDVLLDAVDRAIGQHLLDRGPRLDQRRRRALAESEVAPPQPIGRLGRDPHQRAGGADIAVLRQTVEKAHLALGRPAQRRRPAARIHRPLLPLPLGRNRAAFLPSPLPRRRPIRTIARRPASVAGRTGRTGPRPRRADGPDRPVLGRNPPAPEAGRVMNDAAVVDVIHDPRS